MVLEYTIGITRGKLSVHYVNTIGRTMSVSQLQRPLQQQLKRYNESHSIHIQHDLATTIHTDICLHPMLLGNGQFHTSIYSFIQLSILWLISTLSTQSFFLRTSHLRDSFLAHVFLAAIKWQLFTMNIDYKSKHLPRDQTNKQ